MTLTSLPLSLEQVHMIRRRAAQERAALLSGIARGALSRLGSLVSAHRKRGQNNFPEWRAGPSS